MIELTERIQQAEAFAEARPDSRAPGVAYALVRHWRTGIVPRHKVVPPDLEDFAEQIRSILRGEGVPDAG